MFLKPLVSLLYQLYAFREVHMGEIPVENRKDTVRRLHRPNISCKFMQIKLTSYSENHLWRHWPADLIGRAANHPAPMVRLLANRPIDRPKLFWSPESHHVGELTTRHVIEVAE